MREIVIVGHGIAGLTAKDMLRRQGFDGHITIIGNDPHPPYSRPALSKAALSPTMDLSDTTLPPSSSLATQISETVVGLNTDSQFVTVASGDQYFYDGLVIANGTHARRFTDHEEEYTLRTRDDAQKLRARLQEQPAIIVVGGGPLGMEIASGATSLGCDVTLVHQGLPMRAQVGPVIAGFLAQKAVENGVKIIDALASSVTRSSAEQFTVELDDGREICAPVVVSAIGDSPNIQWLQDSGLLTDGKLVTDSRGRVTHNIVAAGDIACFNGIRTPIWTSAIEQAKTAAGGLLLGNEAPELSFQSYFWTDQFGVNVKVSGPIPHNGTPHIIEGSLESGSALLHWSESNSAASINYRIPVPRLHKLAKSLAPTA